MAVRRAGAESLAGRRRHTASQPSRVRVVAKYPGASGPSFFAASRRASAERERRPDVTFLGGCYSPDMAKAESPGGWLPSWGRNDFDRTRRVIAASPGAGGRVTNPRSTNCQARNAGHRSLTATPEGEAHSSLRGPIPCWRRERTLASGGKPPALTSGRGYDGEAATGPRTETCGHARRRTAQIILGRGFDSRRLHHHKQKARRHKERT